MHGSNNRGGQSQHGSDKRDFSTGTTAASSSLCNGQKPHQSIGSRQKGKQLKGVDEEDTQPEKDDG
jgi:hypothetical protein